MGLKPIELQVAIPRTGEAGAIQNQLLQKPIHDQAMLATAAAKQMEEMRKKSQEVNETEAGLKADKDGQSDSKGHRQSASSKNNKEQSTATVEHPFKGHHIDLSL